MADNPSIVNDESGNNYGGISSGGSMGQANMQYLELLQSMAAKMPPKALPNNAYFPGGNDVQIGSSSSKTLGSQPIFAASNLIPFGMLDEMKRNQAEQEVEYYKNLKAQLNKPLTDIKAKLENPFKQPEFNTKIQNTIDKSLDMYASKLGGNYMQAQVALSQDRNFQRTMQGYAEYANIYNSVYKDAVDVLSKSAKPAEFYVPPEQLAAVNKFVYSHDKLEDTSIDQLLKNGQEFKAKESVFKLAEAASSGVKEVVRDQYVQSKAMSTSDEKVWQKLRTYGDENQVKTIVDDILKANPDYESQRSLLASTVRGHMKWGVEKEIEKIKTENAGRNSDLRKAGLKVDEEGNIEFGTRYIASLQSTVKNAVPFPKTQPTPSPTGLTGYISQGGTWKHVRLNDSYPTTYTSRFDLDKGKGVMPPGSYVEANADLQEVAPYSSDVMKNLKTAGGITVPVDTGKDTRGMAEVRKTQLEDVDTHQIYEVFGNTTIYIPENQADGIVKAMVPHMDYVYEQLDKQGQKLPGVIELTDDMDITDLNQYGPNQRVSRNGKITTVKAIQDLDRMRTKPKETPSATPSLDNLK
jgi:hypothetical protein